MRKLPAIILLIIISMNSCKTGLDLVEQKDLDLIKEEYKKTFKFEEFDTYVFNICEKFEKFDKENRFCDCKENFYNIGLENHLKKVEELYLLKHINTDLVIYLTTFSHKYIHEDGTGFLNNPKHYNHNIVLDQLEYAYIGRMDESNNIIHFPSHNKEKDIILEFDPNYYPQKLFFNHANIATAENNYDISQPISLDTLFKQDIEYLKKKYQMNYYHGSNKMDTVNKKKVNEIKLISNEGKVEVVFGFKNFIRDGSKRYYKMAAKRIKYHPNFYLIQNN